MESILKLSLLLTVLSNSTPAFNASYSFFIEQYFIERRITQLHVLLCREKDAVHLRKARLLADFLLVTYVKREVDWKTFQVAPSGIFVDLSCQRNRHIFNEVPEGLLTLGHSWFVAGSLEEGLRAVSSTEVGLSTDLVLRQPDGSLLELYRPHNEAPIEIRPCRGLTCQTISSRFNLLGRPVRAAIVNFLGMTDDEEGRKKFHLLIKNRTEDQRAELIMRKFYTLHEYLAVLFNFTLALRLSETYGYKLPNGSYNGMISLFIQKKADVGIAPLSMFVERMDFCDYSVSLEPINFILVFVEVRSHGLVTALALPFNLPVWLSAIGIFLLSSAASAVIFYFYHPENKLSEGVMNVLGIHFEQGTEEEECCVDAPASYVNIMPPGLIVTGVVEVGSASSRVLNFFLLWYAVLLTTYYSAAVMNGLLSPSPANIKNMKDLVSQRPMIIANITYLNPIFFNPLVMDKYKERKFPVCEVAEGLEIIQKKSLALIGDGKAIYEKMDQLLTDTQKCSTRELDMQTPFPMSAGIPKNCQFKEMLKLGYIWLKESGIFHRETKFWYPEHPPCLENMIFDPVGVKAITIAVAIYFISIFLAVVILFIEFRCGKNLTKHHKRPFLN